MARIEVEFFSNALVRPVTFRCVLPNDPRDGIPAEETPWNSRPMKTVFSLPGYTGGAEWGDEVLAAKYNTAIISVYGENAFYVDNASPSGKYARFIGEEMVDYVRKTFGLGLHGVGNLQAELRPVAEQRAEQRRILRRRDN